MKSLEDLVAIARKKKVSKRIVIASAEDENVLSAISRYYKMGLLTPVLIGNKEKIFKIIENNNFDLPDNHVYSVQNEIESAKFAVELINKGEADMIMKGLLPTKIFIKEILNKESGIAGEGSLSHVGLFESPFFPKLFGLTDAAINITPGIEMKKHIIQNAVKAFVALGIKRPKVALLAAIEKINPKMQATIDAAELIRMQAQKPFANCILEGPLALDVATSELAAQHKGIKSRIAGSVDILVVPEITVGNVLYKSLTYLGGAKAAGIIVGAKVPVVLSSRTDSEESKFYSIALAYNLSIF
jgi:phosphate butyryltransferase